jgi:hypothetical protein
MDMRPLVLTRGVLRVILLILSHQQTVQCTLLDSGQLLVNVYQVQRPVSSRFSSRSALPICLSSNTRVLLACTLTVEDSAVDERTDLNLCSWK